MESCANMKRKASIRAEGNSKNEKRQELDSAYETFERTESLPLIELISKATSDAARSDRRHGNRHGRSI